MYFNQVKFGCRLRNLRKQRRMTQEALAGSLNISIHSLSMSVAPFKVIDQFSRSILPDHRPERIIGDPHDLCRTRGYG